MGFRWDFIGIFGDFWDISLVPIGRYDPFLGNSALIATGVMLFIRRINRIFPVRRHPKFLKLFYGFNQLIER